MRRGPYQTLKPSSVDWLGAVPEHWAVKRLRFVLTTNPSSREAGHLAPDDKVSFVPMEAVGERGGLDLVATRTATDFVGTYTYFRDDDVVVAKITPCFENGKGAHAAGLVNGAAIGTTELHVLRPHSAALDARFLFYLSISQPFRALGEGAMYGAGGQKRVPDTFIKDYRAPLPPIDEQRTIATFLDRETARIDALVAAKRWLIALLQEKRAALIARAVTRGLDPDVPTKDSGVAWLGRVPAHWEVMTLARLTDKLTNGYVGPTREMFVDEGVPYLQSLHIKNNSIEFGNDYFVTPEWSNAHRKSILREDDVLVVQTGDIGQVARVGSDWADANCHALIICSPNHDRIQGRYLSWLLCSAYGQAQLESLQTGALHPHLNCGNIKHMLLPVPPRAEQDSVAAHLDKEAAAIARAGQLAQATISRLTEYRSTLITSAVTGCIDVRSSKT